MQRAELAAFSALTGALLLLGSIAMIELTAPRDPKTVTQCEFTNGAHVVRTDSGPLCIYGKRAFFVKD